MHLWGPSLADIESELPIGWEYHPRRASGELALHVLDVQEAISASAAQRCLVDPIRCHLARTMACFMLKSRLKERDPARCKVTGVPLPRCLG